jgi:hypothetical protein
MFRVDPSFFRPWYGLFGLSVTMVLPKFYIGDGPVSPSGDEIEDRSDVSPEEALSVLLTLVCACSFLISPLFCLIALP